jgi:outer membrane protein assembly factor BamB
MGLSALRRIAFATVLLVAACTRHEPPKVPNVELGGTTSGEDVTAAFRAWSTAAYAQPPQTFRQGHVTPRTLEANAIVRTDVGFQVSFPSRAPITTPAVHQGKIVVSGGFHGKEVYAFEARTGALAWGLNLDDDGPSAPACEEGVCVFNTESCTIFAVSVRSGELLWSAWLGDPLMSAPAIAGGRVFAAYPARGSSVSSRPSSAPPAEATHALAAFELRTGAILWTRWIDADVISSPVVSGDTVVAATQAGTVFIFDAATGELRSARRARATSAPIVVGKDLFYTQRSAKEGPVAEQITRDGSKQYAAAEKRAVYIDAAVQKASKLAGDSSKLDAQNGFGSGAPESAAAHKALANIGQGSVSSLQTFQGSRLLRMGELQMNVMGDEVVCTTAEDGKERWRQKIKGDMASAGGALASPPAAAGGSLFVATLGGEVLRYDAATGAVRTRYAIGAPVRSQPVVDGGMLYAGTEDGKLVAIDLRDAHLTGWPQWGGNAARTGVQR